MRNYALVTYAGDIDTTDVNAAGELVQLNYKILEGHTDLMIADDARNLYEDFPDRVIVSEVSDDNLLESINYCFDKLEAEVAQLGDEATDILKAKCEYVRNEFGHTGSLKPDRNDRLSLEELAGKAINVQDLLRVVQSNIKKGQTK